MISTAVVSVATLEGIGADALRCSAEEVGDAGKHFAVIGADLPGGGHLEAAAKQGGVVEATDRLSLDPPAKPGVSSGVIMKRVP